MFLWRPMYDLTPATTQANSVQEIGIRLRQLFLFFYATASATGPDGNNANRL